MNSDKDTPCGVGCPIRRSRDHRSLASPPGFSQRATSFIASQCQGIHQMPSLALDPRRNSKGSTYGVPPHKTAAHRGKTLLPASAGCSPRESGGLCRMAASHEDTSRIHSSLAARAYPPRSHDKLSLHPSNNARAPGCPGSRSLRSSPNAGGGGERIRTDDLLLAKQALSQLSYTPFRDQKTGIRDQKF